MTVYSPTRQGKVEISIIEYCPLCKSHGHEDSQGYYCINCNVTFKRK